MKIINLTRDAEIYTSNVYFLLGDWKAVEDVNAMVDVGRDPSIVERIWQLDTGVGKKKVDKVVLTHGHYDHTSLLPTIRDEFDPEVHAFHPLDGRSRALRDGQTLKLADRWFEVIHAPGHTSDSVCIYNADDGALFSGDATLFVPGTDGSYQEGFVAALERIARRDVRKIYPGHGNPMTHGVKRLLYMSLDNIRKSKIF